MSHDAPRRVGRNYRFVESSRRGASCYIDEKGNLGGSDMKPFYACNSPEHGLSRRQFLTGTAAGAMALGFKDMLTSANAEALRRQDKRVLVIFLAGGVSQLESWDPKPATNTGGPFQAIPTSVPGTHISELLPYTAQQMHRL